MKNIEMKYIVYIVLSLYSVASLGQNIPAIDLNSPRKLDGSYAVSQLGKKFTYVDLETAPDCVIGKVNNLFICDEFIFVQDPKKVLQFKSDGTFLRQIGREGKGPGEYNSIVASGFDKEREIILIYDVYGKRLLEYNFLGQHKNTYPISDGPNHIIACPSGDWLMVYFDKISRAASDDYVMAELFSPDMQLKKEFISPFNHNADPGGLIMLPMERIHNNGNRLYFRWLRSDEVLQLKGEQLEPIIKVDFSKFEMPFKEYTIKSFMEKKLGGDYLYLKDMIIWDDLAFYQYAYLDKEFYGFYTFSTGESVKIGKSGISQKLTDDIDNGPGFWPYDVSGSSLFDFVNPVDVDDLDKWNRNTGLKVTIEDNPVIRILMR